MKMHEDEDDEDACMGAHNFAHKRGRVPKDPNDAEYGAAREQADDDDRTQSDA